MTTVILLVEVIVWLLKQIMNISRSRKRVSMISGQILATIIWTMNS